MRQCRSFELIDLSSFKAKMQYWSQDQSVCCILDSNEYPDDKFGRYELLAGFGKRQTVKVTDSAFEALRELQEQYQDWMMGYLSYELKNELENLRSANTDMHGAPKLCFFIPEIVIWIEKGKTETCQIECYAPHSPEEIWDALEATEATFSGSCIPEGLQLQCVLNRQAYLNCVNSILQHIIEGDCYELNFCMQFFLEEIDVDSSCLYHDLNKISKAPFAAFLKWEDLSIICGSPERFLQKSGQKLISQPIKGTISRGNNLEDDLRQKQFLLHDPKERAENVMITDLVRNDLARTAQTGTVVVDELFGVYSFEKVHHLISTVSSMLSTRKHAIDAIKAAFPMGSMTGAPKVKTMELIEQYEASTRGIYSGSIGYISPEGDFDFNVVIRSMIYSENKSLLSFHVGGAITYDSIPEREYAECLLKARNILQSLGLSL